MEIYVLELAGGKLYIGQSTNVDERFDRHKNGTGCEWTWTYPPIKIDDRYERVSIYNELVETLERMSKKGIDEVRGGPFAFAVIYDRDRYFITCLIRSVHNLCINCGSSRHKINDCTNQKKPIYTIDELENSTELIYNELVKALDIFYRDGLDGDCEERFRFMKLTYDNKCFTSRLIRCAHDLCMVCGSSKHMANECPNKKNPKHIYTPSERTDVNEPIIVKKLDDNKAGICVQCKMFVHDIADCYFKNACFHCLSFTHEFLNCPYRDKGEKVIRTVICKQEHNINYRPIESENSTKIMESKKSPEPKPNPIAITGDECLICELCYVYGHKRDDCPFRQCCLHCFASDHWYSYCPYLQIDEKITRFEAHAKMAKTTGDNRWLKHYISK